LAVSAGAAAACAHSLRPGIRAIVVSKTATGRA
jgi:hypothetical protein